MMIKNIRETLKEIQERAKNKYMVRKTLWGYTLSSYDYFPETAYQEYKASINTLIELLEDCNED